jgi:hypothetical protein
MKPGKLFNAFVLVSFAIAGSYSITFLLLILDTMI